MEELGNEILGRFHHGPGAIRLTTHGGKGDDESSTNDLPGAVMARALLGDAAQPKKIGWHIWARYH
jgi:hypothetical protein